MQGKYGRQVHMLVDSWLSAPLRTMSTYAFAFSSVRIREQRCCGLGNGLGAKLRHKKQLISCIDVSPHSVGRVLLKPPNNISHVAIRSELQTNGWDGQVLAPFLANESHASCLRHAPHCCQNESKHAEKREHRQMCNKAQCRDGETSRISSDPLQAWLWRRMCGKTFRFQAVRVHRTIPIIHHRHAHQHKSHTTQSQLFDRKTDPFI